MRAFKRQDHSRRGREHVLPYPSCLLPRLFIIVLLLLYVFLEYRCGIKQYAVLEPLCLIPSALDAMEQGSCPFLRLSHFRPPFITQTFA